MLRARTDGDEPMPREVVAEIVQELRLVDLDSQGHEQFPPGRLSYLPHRLVSLGSARRMTLVNSQVCRLPAARIQLLDVFAGLTRFTDDPIGVFLENQILDFRCVVER